MQSRPTCWHWRRWNSRTRRTQSRLRGRRNWRCCSRTGATRSRPPNPRCCRWSNNRDWQENRPRGRRSSSCCSTGDGSQSRLPRLRCCRSCRTPAFRPRHPWKTGSPIKVPLPQHAPGSTWSTPSLPGPKAPGGTTPRLLPAEQPPKPPTAPNAPTRDEKPLTPPTVPFNRVNPLPYPHLTQLYLIDLSRQWNYFTRGTASSSQP